MWGRIQRSRSAKSLRPLQWHPAQAKRAIRMLLTNLTGHAHPYPHTGRCRTSCGDYRQLVRSRCRLRSRPILARVQLQPPPRTFPWLLRRGRRSTSPHGVSPPFPRNRPRPPCSHPADRNPMCDVRSVSRSAVAFTNRCPIDGCKRRRGGPTRAGNLPSTT